MSNPNDQVPISDTVLAHHLSALLKSHGIDSKLRLADVLVEGNESTWARLSISDDSTPTVLRIRFEAATREGTILFDSLNGLGDDIKSRAKDALVQFCVADFHVFLASVWGLLEEDQVDHHAVVTENGAWDLYLGAWVSRMSNPAETIPVPEGEFTAKLLGLASQILTERKPTTGRVFVATLKGEMTYEALLDGEFNATLESLLRSISLQHSVTGYASQRLFFIAIPRDGATAHRQISRCTKPRSKDTLPNSRRSRSLALAIVAILLLVALYLQFFRNHPL